MKRYTARNEDGSVYYPHCFKEGGCSGKLRQCDSCRFQRKADERLAAYEDSGLGPKEVARLVKKGWTAKEKQTIELEWDIEGEIRKPCHGVYEDARILRRLEGYERLRLSPEEIREKLEELEKLREHLPPCRPGDKIYPIYVSNSEGVVYEELEVRAVSLMGTIRTEGEDWTPEEQIQYYVCYTRAAAEAKSKKLREMLENA